MNAKDKELATRLVADVERTVAELLTKGTSGNWKLEYLLSHRDGGFHARVTFSEDPERWFTGQGESTMAAIDACFTRALARGVVA